MESLRTRTLHQLFFGASVAAAIAVFGWWIFTIVSRTPNLPFTDEWTWADLSIASRTSQDIIPLLTGVHNGHRNVFGSLIFLLIDRLGGWNVIAEDIVGLAILMIGLISLRFFVARHLPAISRDIVFAFGALTIAGAQAFENFLIGYNIDWQICTAAVLIVADRITAGGRRNMIIAASAALIASFSSSQGLLIWVAGACALVLLKRPRAFVAWLACATVCIGVYFIGYSVDGQDALRVHNFTEFRHFVEALLGVPLNAHLSVKMLRDIGVVVFFGVIAAPIIAYFAKVDLKSLAGWAVFAFYGLAATILTAFTRGGIGPEQAFSPRYESLSVFVILGVVGVFATIVKVINRPTISVGATCIGLTLCGIAALASQYSSTVVTLYESQRAEEVRVLLANQESKYAEFAYPNPQALNAWLRALDSVGDNPLRKLVK